MYQVAFDRQCLTLCDCYSAVLLKGKGLSRSLASRGNKNRKVQELVVFGYAINTLVTRVNDHPIEMAIVMSYSTRIHGHPNDARPSTWATSRPVGQHD